MATRRSATIRSGWQVLLVAGFTGLALAGCQSSAGDQNSNVFRNLLLYGGPTVPPVAPPNPADIDCPAVTVLPGGGYVRVGGEDASSVRHQISLNNYARECVPVGTDGAYTLKIGIEGLAVLGPAGGGRALSTPVRFIVRRGDAIIADRTRTVNIAIPQGQAQALFTAVEEGISVSPGPTPTVEIGFGAGPRQTARRPRG